MSVGCWAFAVGRKSRTSKRKVSWCWEDWLEASQSKFFFLLWGASCQKIHSAPLCGVGQPLSGFHWPARSTSHRTQDATWFRPAF